MKDFLQKLDQPITSAGLPGSVLYDKIKTLMPPQPGSQRILLDGTSGEDKARAAAVIGSQLNKEVYRIDLAGLLSKYIGETEKNLDLLFAKAEQKAWILFFDEADALFEKRSEVRDAHDKYANQEIGYILQRIEEFAGPLILGTNKKSAIDPAFLRRIRFAVTVPL